jgi:hypothetical protein
MRNTIVIDGMHGLGDNIHQRAIVRALMRERDVWLSTPWPSVYHDLVDDGLMLAAPRNIRLRTQLKNVAREGRFYRSHGLVNPGPYLRSIKMRYPPEEVRRAGSVLGAMGRVAGVAPQAVDMRLPVPCEWKTRAVERIGKWNSDLPWLVYRPLVERKEWLNPARNPDFVAYAELFRAIRDRFFVVSVADLAPNVEWIVGEPIKADVELHAGELDFPTLAGLVALADMTFTSPGFMVPLSQAIGTPCITVFGSYESSRSFSAGASVSRWLPIDVMYPCEHFRHACGCCKAIDMPAAFEKIERFCDETASCSVAA